jgi:ligand-binding sensor domain-containing protein/serine phosphatase RsbU (regulator of sigma subunit)
MNKLLKHIVFLFLFISISGFSQTGSGYSFTHFNFSNGFPAEYVYGMECDSIGNMWAITDKGLMCYNGHSGKFFDIKSKDTTLAKGRPYSLYIDNRGDLWIGFVAPYITHFNPKTGKSTHYYHNSNDPNSFPDAMVSTFYEDSQGRFWVGTWGGGLCQFDLTTKKFKRYKSENGDFSTLQSTNAVSITEDRDGSLIIGTWEGDGFENFLTYFNPQTEDFSFFNLDEYALESEVEKEKTKAAFRIVHFVEMDELENLWVGTFTGLFYVDRHEKIITRVTGMDKDLLNSHGQITFDNVLTCLYENNDVIWFPTETDGIMVYDSKSKEVKYIRKELEKKSSLSGNFILDVLKDRYGNIWVATNSGGLDVYCPTDRQFTILSNEKLKAQKMYVAQGTYAINHFAVSNVSDNIIIAHGGGATVYNVATGQANLLDVRAAFLEALRQNPSLEKFNHNNPNFVGAVYETGSVYVLGTYIGEVRYNTVTAKFDFSRLALSGGFYPTEYIGYDKVLLMGAKENPSDQSLGRSIPYLAEYSVSTKAEKKLIDLPLKLETGEDGDYRYFEKIDSLNYFIGASGNTFMIYHEGKNEIETFSSKEPLANFPDENIRPLHVDNYGLAWLATENGLYGFDYKNGQSFDIRPELNLEESDVIKCLTRDKNGILWIGLKYDLVRYNPDTKEVFRFTTEHGFDGGGFTERYLRRHNREEVIMPCSYGLLMFDPKRITFHTSTPSVFISDIIIDKDTLNFESRNQFLSQSNELKYNQNFITIEFASDLLYASEGKIYEYRLLGLDSAWTRVMNQNKVNYTNLGSGEYEFQVRCIDGYDNMSETVSFSFVINKPFWWQWWFILLEIFVLVGGVIFYIDLRERNLKKSREQLKKAVAIRTHEVSEKVLEIEAQKSIIEVKNKELTDSINYAKGIQNTLLANRDLLKKNLPDHMIFFKPKDIVSGDFYWAAKSEDAFYLAVCDSTGHGVPGAFMSLLNIRYLNEAIVEKNIQSPNIVLDYVRNQLIENLAFNGTKDGMDGTLIKFDYNSNILTYASAQNSPVLVRNGEAKLLPADKMPIGGGYLNEPFQPHQVVLKEGDVVYFYTDGYPDQFGGPRGGKLKHANLLKFLVSIHHLPLLEQHIRLDQHLSAWKGDLEQLDDILLVAVKARGILN